MIGFLEKLLPSHCFVFDKSYQVPCEEVMEEMRNKQLWEMARKELLEPSPFYRSLKKSEAKERISKQPFFDVELPKSGKVKARAYI